MKHPPRPEGYRYAHSKECDGTVRQFAREMLRRREPLGTRREFIHAPLSDGRPRTYLAQVEWHYHDPEGPVRPHGWHHGVTVYVLD